MALRAFLGLTFCFAGLQKLANPAFLDPSNPVSIQSQLAGAARRSPVHALVSPLIHVAGPLGIVIALAELAVGLGALLGLWTRLAAVGGMALSALLFLTVSFHASPYYTGSDIVFVFAWTPLVIAGAGGAPSLDGVLANLALRRAGVEPDTDVAVSFSTVRDLCGFYQRGCKARGGAPCEPRQCPVLAERRGAPALPSLSQLRSGRGARPAGGRGTARRPRPGEIDRRTFSLKGAWTFAVAAAGVFGASLAAGVGRAMGGHAPVSRAGDPGAGATVSGAGSPATPGATSSTTGATTTAPPGSATSSPPTTRAAAPATTRPPGTRIGPASAVPVAGAAAFRDPGTGDPALVIQPKAGTFLAFDAVCSHAGCVVEYDRSGVFVCPCHGSVFNGRSGAVEGGPAPTGLTRLAIRKGSDGMLYVDGSG